MQLLATVSAAFMRITSLGEVVRVHRNRSELDLIGGPSFLKAVSQPCSRAPLLTFLSLTGCRGRTVSRRAAGGGIRVLQTAGRRERSPPDIHPPLPLGQEVQPTTPDSASAQPGSSGWRRRDGAGLSSNRSREDLFFFSSFCGTLRQLLVFRCI